MYFDQQLNVKCFYFSKKNLEESDLAIA